MIHLRTLNALEFSKITALLASFCLTEEGRTRAESLLPAPTQGEADFALTLFDAFLAWQADTDVRRLYVVSAVPDVSPLFRALSRPSFLPDANAFWALRSVLNTAKNARSAILLSKSAAWQPLATFAEGHELPKTLLQALNRCISDDALLKDESSPELYRLRTEIRSLHQHCLGKVRDFANKYNILSYLQEEFMTISQDRYVLPLKATYKGRLQGILHDWSQTGETCYFEPMFLVELNNRLQGLKREEREEEMRVLDYLADLLRREREAAESALALLSELDFLNAKKRMAEKLSARIVRCTPREEGLHLYAARHPLLVLQEEEAKERKETPHLVHPLDIALRPDDRCLLITGGNAGGKTVCLKTLGLIQTMVQSGLPVPCDQGSHLFWLERMDAFIGDEQDLGDHVSTFTAQIKHLAKAWKHLTEGSLVLLDEFGAGTDPTHGAALAQAVLERLLERGSVVLCATHFPTLKIWALSSEHVRAASMLFDPHSKRPLFRLAYDQVGQSQTLLVAREHGLPEEIICRAEKILLVNDEETGSLLDRLNALALSREKELDELRRLQKKNDADTRNLREKLSREREDLIGEVSKTIQELMRAWKSGKIQAKEAMTQLKQERAKLTAQRTEETRTASEPLRAISAGQKVRHKTLQKTGLVTDVDERKGRARLDLGGISIWASLADLQETAGAPRISASPAGTGVTDPGFMPLLDVRGERLESAQRALERFLDKNVLAGLSSVEIVHGRGTGVLRRAIHSYLSTCPGIDHFELAPEDQGGDGKTIVYFR
ncbi:MAG: Smr/MutS family protein [Desulfovibrio sp.]|nr:Smr/MutS family protein [Desulfovibrio sp.]